MAHWGWRFPVESEGCVVPSGQPRAAWSTKETWPRQDRRHGQDQPHRGDVINCPQLLQQGCGDGEEQPTGALLAMCGHGSCNTSWSASKGCRVCRKACVGFRGGRAHCWKEKGNEGCQSRMHQARKCPELHANGASGKQEVPLHQAFRHGQKDQACDYVHIT